MTANVRNVHSPDDPDRVPVMARTGPTHFINGFHGITFNDNNLVRVDFFTVQTMTPMQKVVVSPGQPPPEPIFSMVLERSTLAMLVNALSGLLLRTNEDLNAPPDDQETT